MNTRNVTSHILAMQTQGFSSFGELHSLYCPSDAPSTACIRSCFGYETGPAQSRHASNQIGVLTKLQPNQTIPSGCLTGCFREGSTWGKQKTRPAILANQTIACQNKTHHVWSTGSFLSLPPIPSPFAGLSHTKAGGAEAKEHKGLGAVGKPWGKGGGRWGGNTGSKGARSVGRNLRGRKPEQELWEGSDGGRRGVQGWESPTRWGLDLFKKGIRLERSWDLMRFAPFP